MDIALKCTPCDVYVLERVGRYYKKNADTKVNLLKAISLLQKCVDYSPKLHIAWHHLGLAYRTLWIVDSGCPESVAYLRKRYNNPNTKHLHSQTRGWSGDWAQRMQLHSAKVHPTNNEKVDYSDNSQRLLYWCSKGTLQEDSILGQNITARKEIILALNIVVREDTILTLNIAIREDSILASNIPQTEATVLMFDRTLQEDTMVAVNLTVTEGSILDLNITLREDIILRINKPVRCITSTKDQKG